MTNQKRKINLSRKNEWSAKPYMNGTGKSKVVANNKKLVKDR